MTTTMALTCESGIATLIFCDHDTGYIRRVVLHKHFAYWLAVHVQHMLDPTPEIARPHVPMPPQFEPKATKNGGINLCVLPPLLQEGPRLFADIDRETAELLVKQLVQVAVHQHENTRKDTP